MKNTLKEKVKNYFKENRNEILLGYIGLSSLGCVGSVREGLRK